MSPCLPSRVLEGRRQLCRIPWQSGRPALGPARHSHWKADTPCTFPDPLPCRFSCCPPCWRAHGMTQRWWWHAWVWAAERGTDRRTSHTDLKGSGMGLIPGQGGKETLGSRLGGLGCWRQPRAGSWGLLCQGVGSGRRSRGLGELPYTMDRREAERGPAAGLCGAATQVPGEAGPAHQPGVRAARCLLVQCSHGCPVGIVLVRLFLSLPDQVRHTVLIQLWRVESPALGIGFPFSGGGGGGGRARIFPLVRIPGISRVPQLSCVLARLDFPPQAGRPGVAILSHLGPAPGPGLELDLRGLGRTWVERHGWCGWRALHWQRLWWLLMARGGGWSPGGLGATGGLEQESGLLS